MKLLSITWNYTDESNYKDSLLYKSFIKNNDDKDFINIHFNRNEYSELEKDFENNYGYQFEFILYKIFLLKSTIPRFSSLS